MSEAARVARHKSNETVAESSSGYVDHLYTWGAAAVLRGGFLPDRRRSDGCWQGFRIVNINVGFTGTWYVDIVNGIANVVGYWHANQPTVKMDQNGKANYFPCGNTSQQWLEIPSVDIHLQDVYESRADTLNGDARTLTKYFVTASYKVAQEAASMISPSGWKLVGSSEWDSKETHLMQHPSSKECVLSFQGTANDRVLDWWDNLRFYDTPFCGLGDNVHGGFRDQLRAILDSASFRENIQSKLPKCSELTVIGHSLGGAMAALYSYCLNAGLTQGADGWEDYNRVQFSRSTPEVIPSMF